MPYENLIPLIPALIFCALGLIVETANARAYARRIVRGRDRK